MKKVTFIFTIMITLCAMHLSAVDSGFTWALRANFNGTATLPSINEEDMDKIAAQFMKGAVGYTMDGEAELGYNFGGERFFNMQSNKVFGGMSLFGSIGIGSGFSGQIAGATIAGNSATMYITVNYAPVITFGIGTKAYMLQDRLALGLWVGSKMIADLSPEYLAYFDNQGLNETYKLPEIGEIIVTPFMMKNMNPFSFSSKFLFEYLQPVNDKVGVILAGYLRFNLWSPKYITMPPKLMELIQGVRPEFTVETPLPSYFLNSLDFGVSLGLNFRV